MDKSAELIDLSKPEKIEYLLSLKEDGMSAVAICQQYDVSRSTFYYWLSRYEEHDTYEDLSRAPHQTHRKVTENAKTEVIKKHKENPRLGCWRLSLYDYDGVELSSVTIWHIINETKQPKEPSEESYTFTHFHQTWFIDHTHLRTLPNGQKVYSLIVLDCKSRVLLSDEICLTKSARDACLILLKTFAQWGLPDEILSDNAKAFTSKLYTLLIGGLNIGIRYTTPGHPWENPFAESLIRTAKAYLYPHIQRKKSVESIGDIYSENAFYYNNRTHWSFKDDEIKTPFGKLAETKGRPMPEEFSLETVTTGRSFSRTVDGHGRISWKRYRLYVDFSLKKEKVEIHELFTSLVITYKSGSVVTYKSSYEQNDAKITSIENKPLFHEISGIKKSVQLELFDLTDRTDYVTRRQKNRKRKKYPKDATQLEIESLLKNR